jgi:TonB family protein
MTALVWIAFFAAFGAIGDLHPWAVQRLVGMDYPRHALLTGSQGTVELLCFIGNDGKVIRVDRISGNEELAAAAIRNASNWKFRRMESGEGGYKLVYRFQIHIVSALTGTPRFRFVMPADVFITAEKLVVAGKRP